MGCHVTATFYLPDDLIATVRSRITRQPKGDAMRGLQNEINSLNSLARRGKARVFVASATASQTVTCSYSGVVNGTDELTIAGTVLAVEASPANQSEFLKGSSDATFAANLAACINAHTTLNKIVNAAVTTGASGIVTIYANVPGPIGNLVTLAKTGNGFTIGAATLANGASDAVKEHVFGYDTETRLTA